MNNAPPSDECVKGQIHLNPWSRLGAAFNGARLPFPSRLTRELIFQTSHDLANVRIYFHPVFDGSARMQNCAVIPPTEGLTNGVQ